MKHILVTGGNGQLGSSLRSIASRYDGFHFTFIDYEDLDLTDEIKTVEFVKKHHPDYVLNCAAYTAVDQAEKEPELAYRVNAGIPATMAEISTHLGVRVIHISTDYVYDGEYSVPHSEDEMTSPSSVYGKSKLAGEEELKGNSLAIIIRTSWLYGEYGRNFMKSMLSLGADKKEIGVVFDQTGTPTWSGDLARVLLDIIVYCEKHGFKAGIYNYSNEGVCSWYDFAVEIMKQSGSGCQVKPILTAEYPLPAKRPEYSVLDKSRIKKTFGLEIPYWRDSLSEALANLKKNQEI